MRRYSNWLSTSAASSISVATSPAAAAAALALVGLPPSSTELPLSLPVTRCLSLSCLLASLAAWLALTSLPS